HRLAGRRRARLADLGEETFVDFPTGSPGRAQSKITFADAKIDRDVAFEAMGTDMMLDLVRQGLAVVLLSPEVVPCDDGLRTIALTDGPSRVEYLAWSNFNPSPAATAFLGFARAGHGTARASALQVLS